MSLKDRRDRPATHAQEILRRIDHLIAALQHEAQQLIADSEVSDVKLTMVVDADGVDTKLHIDEEQLRYPATVGVRVASD